MTPSAQEAREVQPDGVLRRALRALLMGITLLFVVTALSVSSALVVYTAWLHDLRNGVFALIFAVLSAQIALNWLVWKEDEYDSEDTV